MTLSTLRQRFAFARLSRPCLPGSSSRRFRDAHHHGFWPQQLAVAWDQRPDRRTRRAHLHLSYSCASPCGPAMHVTQGTNRPCRLPLVWVRKLGSSCQWCACAARTVSNRMQTVRRGHANRLAKMTQCRSSDNAELDRETPANRVLLLAHWHTSISGIVSG
jgi:hypothetical protein